MKKLRLILILFFSVTMLQAQMKCPCCTEPYEQFDFWVGEWNVLTALGNKVGENSISKIEKNCLLVEHWTGIEEGTGTSVNYFDKSDKTWNQLWMDSSGNLLKLKGQFTKGKMVLKGKLKKGIKNKRYYNQITWTPNKDGTVTQRWEIFNNKHKLIKTIFVGIYHRKK